jgi:hypothetical protein
VKRLPLAIAVFGSYFLFGLLTPSTASVNCVNSNCVAAAGSSWLSLAFGPILFFVLAYLPKTPWLQDAESVAGIRKFLGIAVDLTANALALGALAVLPMLFAEALHTGHFEWAYRRDFARLSD